MSFTDQFPVARWLQDFHNLGENPKKIPWPGPFHEAHLESEYLLRFESAKRYLLRHWQEFDEPDVAVIGETTSLMTNDLFFALYKHFMTIRLSQLLDDIPVAQIIATTQAVRAQRRAES